MLQVIKTERVKNPNAMHALKFYNSSNKIYVVP